MMQSTSEGCMNIAELANQLRREKIFINSERQLIQNLNEEVEKTVLELLQAAWICSQQRQNLNNLINSRSEADSIAACQRASLVEATTFINAQKVLKYKEVQALGELLGWLRNTPNLMALCLMLGEDHMPASLPCSLAAGLYGSCRSPADRTCMLAVIRSLIKYQMAPSGDPRKVLRSNKSALSLLYSVFRDNHAPARQFLISVLRAPVLAVLTEDEFFLDVDPDKAMERFTPADRAKKFGQTNSPEYNTKTARYRKWIIQSLYNLTSKFISSLKENWATFPSSIAWIVQQIVHLLKQNSRSTDRDIHAICTELVLGQLVCPAVVSPEQHGVVSAPLSYIARFNLLQVAHILQMLSLARYQEVDPKVRDLYMKFDRSCVWSLVDSVAGEGFAPASLVPPPDTPLRTDAPPPATVALYTPQDAHLLITFLRKISSKLNNNTQNGNEERSNGPTENTVDAGFSGQVREVGAGSAGEDGAGCARLEALVANNDHNYRSRLHDLLRKMPDFTTLRASPSESREWEGRRGLLGRRRRDERERESENRQTDDMEVLVVRLQEIHDHEYVGLVPETKVLESYYGEAEGEDAGALVAAAAPVQKRTRFSVSHDEVSLGNTSDNLEAVSEAASNHSVTSSLELETEDQNDNLSDMVSANVSGRGSPNISGRETPSSQVTDGDPAVDQALRRVPANAPVNQAVSAAHAKMLKQARNDIEDKFCKFEIKKLLEGDETISIMSDTWSTDVLASDSETIGDSCDTAQPAPGQGSNANTIAPDVSETASESAWSVDVLASDSDRNTEVDTDDCVSVAARSDTSWPRRASHHDDLTRGHLAQNGTVKRPDINSPRHSSTAQLPNRSGVYLSATAALSRGGELDLSTLSTRCDHRKSILVNGYPVMTCYASAPESPSTAPALPNDVFDYPHNNGGSSSSTIEGGSAEGAEAEASSEAGRSSCSTAGPLGGGAPGSDATSQWVDDSFPDKYLPSTSKGYEDNDMDRSLNSSESSFNAMSASQYDRRFESGAEPEQQRAEPERSFTDLVTRMSAATISTNIANISRIAKTELRTSIVNISSSRTEKKRETSNISLSTLSVNSENSVSDKSSSQDVNSDNVTERRVSPPPRNTGAIPKSISFDATAEKTQRRRIIGEDGLVGNLDELKNNVKRSGGSLLHKIKMFRHKGRSHHGDMKVSSEEVAVEESRERDGESSEEILAKYRRAADSARRPRHDGHATQAPATHDHDRCEGVVDLNDPEVFNNMKRRLRVVLSNIDFHCVDYVPNRCTSTSLSEWCRAGSSAECAAVSRALAAGAGGAGGAGRTARLAAALRADLAARRPYAAYLASCRASLAHALYMLQSEVKAVRGEWSRWARAAAAARVMDQLERGSSLRRLAHHTQHTHALINGGELLDERATRLTASIKAITAEIKADPSWEGASSTMLESVEETVERAVYTKLYLHVLFPNGDGDIARDQVFSEHIRRVICVCGGAVGVGVSARHLWAAPFPHAQQQLRALSAHRTPRDKLRCVLRCVRSLLATLALSSNDPPAADDLTPALVYVILKVNPPSLLSTLELVSALSGPSLQGESLYWWTQFCAAVAYIKTMDYPPPPASHTHAHDS